MKEPYSDHSFELNYGKEGSPSLASPGHNGRDGHIVFRSVARHDTATLQHCRASLHSTGRSHLPPTEDRVLARCLPGNAIGHIVQRRHRRGNYSNASAAARLSGRKIRRSFSSEEGTHQRLGFHPREVAQTQTGGEGRRQQARSHHHSHSATLVFFATTIAAHPQARS